MGIGKSAILKAALKLIEPRPSEWRQFDPITAEAEADTALSRLPQPVSPDRKPLTLAYLSEHQAKGQLLQLAKRLLETGILLPSSLDLAKKYDEMPPIEIEWSQIRRHVNRLSIRDLSGAIIPAIYEYKTKDRGQVLIAVDDMTRLTPTQQAFWLALFDHAKVVTCASEKKAGLRKLWWKMKEISVPALPVVASKEIVNEYIARQDRVARPLSQSCGEAGRGQSPGDS